MSSYTESSRGEGVHVLFGAANDTNMTCRALFPQSHLSFNVIFDYFQVHLHFLLLIFCIPSMHAHAQPMLTS